MSRCLKSLFSKGKVTSGKNTSIIQWNREQHKHSKGSSSALGAAQCIILYFNQPVLLCEVCHIKVIEGCFSA